VLVPSRGRPDNVARLRAAWADTGATADLRVLVDDDDPTLADYGTDVVVGPRRRIGPLLNDVSASLVDDYDVIGFMGDDHCPRTRRWDAAILAASSPWSVVYGDDLFQGENIPTAVFMGSSLIRELGYFNPPGCEHLYLDNAWKLYGQYLGTLRYLPDVVIEHVHYLAGKAVEDDLYREVNAPAMYAHDQRVYTEWANGQAAVDLDRVKAAMA